MDGMELWKVQVDQLKVQMEQWMEQGSEIVRQIPPIQLYVGVGVLLLTTLLLLFSESPLYLIIAFCNCISRRNLEFEI